MLRWALLPVLLACATPVHAHGLLIPDDRNVPPLALKQQSVKITIQDQVALTRLEQTFYNHTERNLEATYVFPVPKGASVNKFIMTVNGKDVKAETVEADKARQIYTSAVQQSKDPALLDYLGTDLYRVRIVAKADSEQKVSISYDSVARREGGLVEFVYPMKASGKSAPAIDQFAIDVKIQSQHGVENVYSPSHAIVLKRKSDKEMDVVFMHKEAIQARDFTLYYTLGDKNVGLTALTHRPVAGDDGHFLMLITPQLKMAKEHQAPRDIVLVLDTSGSMQGAKIKQARNALKHCLGAMTPTDRFAVVTFATSVNNYRDKLAEASADEIARAKRWVDEIDATGGTAINDALLAALDLRTNDEGRTFNVVFFTDGMPTVGETNAEKIMKNVLAKNNSNTRLFTFGVGDDVNATLLDELAARSRAWATYVRPEEDIEAKVSVMYTKISHPVLTNLKIEVTGEVQLKEMYPPQLPDLFHGGQLPVAGRFTGKGPSAIKLTGMIGKEKKEFVYELIFPERTGDGKEFVEHLWARRKVGYLLNEIRANGEKKELTDEVTALAKRYGIVTPYTSYLLVPDGQHVAQDRKRIPSGAPVGTPPKPVPTDRPDVRFNGGQVGGPTIGGLPGGQFGGQIGFQAGSGLQGGFQGGQFGFQGGFQRAGFGGGGGGSGRPGVPGRPGFTQEISGSFTNKPSGPKNDSTIITNTGPGALPPGSGWGPSAYAGGGFGGQFGFGGGFQGGFQGGIPPGPAPLFETQNRIPEKSDLGKNPEASKPAEPTAETALALARSLRRAGIDGNSVVQPLTEVGKGDQAEATRQLEVHLKARTALLKGLDVQSGQLGVDLSIEVEKLRQQTQLGLTGKKKVAGRDLQLVAGLWIDKEFKEKTAALVVKAQSKAYFRLLEKHPELKDVFRLGNSVIWIAPSGTALVIDTNDGKEDLKDDEIEKLFAVKN